MDVDVLQLRAKNIVSVTPSQQIS